jgi:hypothetical protein
MIGLIAHYTARDYTVQFTITYTTLHSLHYSCLAAALNGESSPASELTSSQAGDHDTQTSDCWLQLVLPSAVVSRAELTNCRFSTNSLTQSWLFYKAAARTAQKT